VPAREKLSPLAACWSRELGGLNKDSNERTRIREESRKGGQGAPQSGGGAADPAGEQAPDPGVVLAAALAVRDILFSRE